MTLQPRSDDTDPVNCLHACVDAKWHNSSFVSDVGWCVMLPFDPENECCFCPKGWVGVGGVRISLSPLCLLRTTQSRSLGPWDPKSLDIRGLWDAPCPHPAPPFHSTVFNLIMCCQLTDRWNNYEHLVQQICANMWKGQTSKVTCMAACGVPKRKLYFIIFLAF